MMNLKSYNQIHNNQIIQKNVKSKNWTHLPSAEFLKTARKIVCVCSNNRLIYSLKKEGKRLKLMLFKITYVLNKILVFKKM